MNRFVLVVAVLLGVSGCSEPLVTIPGGELAGVQQDAPAQWSQVPDTIQLETRRSDPYSINIWGVGVEEHLYVATGSDGTKWTPFIESDASVRVRVDGDLYPLREPGGGPGRTRPRGNGLRGEVRARPERGLGGRGHDLPVGPALTDAGSYPRAWPRGAYGESRTWTTC